MDSRHLLQTLPSGDKHGPRQSAGLGLMQHETEQLRTYIDDLETSLATNRQLLHDVLAQNLRSIAGTGETTEDTVDNPERIQELLQRNKRLEEELKLTILTRNEAQGRALINEQIANEYQQKEQEITQEYEDLIRELDYQIDKRDKIQAELEVRAETLGKEVEIVRKSKDVTVASLSDTTLKMHNFIEKVRTRVQDVGRELHRTRERKEELQDLSNQLFADISKAQALVRNPHNRRIGSERNPDISRRDRSFDSGYHRKSSHNSSHSDSEDSINPGKATGKITPQPRVTVPKTVESRKKTQEIYYTSLQEESFKRPKRTPTEEKLEEESYQLTAKIDGLNKKLELLTQELLSVSTTNDRLTLENTQMTSEIEELQLKVQKYEKSVLMNRRDSRARGSTLIKEHKVSGPVAVLRVAGKKEESDGSVEIVVRSESFYGEDEESLENH